MEFESGEVRKVRRVLWHWGRVDKRIDDLIERMRVAVDRANSLYEVGGSRPMDGQPRGSMPGDPVFRAVEQIQRMRELFAQEIETCEAQIREEQDFKVAVNNAISKLTPVQQDVLRLRYVGHHDWVYIGYKLFMTDRNARRYDFTACAELAQIIDVS